MDRKESIFFLCVTLIVLALIYYIFKKFKGRTLPTPSPSDQTGELSISDLKFTRTLNPDKSNSKSEISGYTIEYDVGIDYAELSENVTFTINWKNNIGFTDNVKGFKIEHFVRPKATWWDTSQMDTPIYSKDFTTTTPQQVSIIDYETNGVSMISDGNHSVIGDNKFKIYAILNNETTIGLYDGLAFRPIDGTNTDTTHIINVSKDDLGATLEMTNPQSVTYIPVVSSDTMTIVRKAITKVKYDISNVSDFYLDGDHAIYLIPATPGDADNAETFFLQYTDDQYFLYDLTKGDWNGKSNRTADNLNAAPVDYDNRMYIAFYNKSDTTDNNIKVQLRKTNMGHGQGIEFISTDKDDKLVLVDMSSKTSTVPELVYNNSFWTFKRTIASTAGGSLIHSNSDGKVYYFFNPDSPTTSITDKYGISVDGNFVDDNILHTQGQFTSGSVSNSLGSEYLLKHTNISENTTITTLDKLLL